MQDILFSDVCLFNAAQANADGTALGCQGFALYGKEFTEIHTVLSGFSEAQPDDQYLVVNKTVASISRIEDASDLIDCIMTMTGTQYFSTLSKISVGNWLLNFDGACGQSLNLLSSDELDRTLSLKGLDSSILFTVVGSRILLELRSHVGTPLPFQELR